MAIVRSRFDFPATVTYYTIARTAIHPTDLHFEANEHFPMLVGLGTALGQASFSDQINTCLLVQLVLLQNATWKIIVVNKCKIRHFYGKVNPLTLSFISDLVAAADYARK